MNEAWIAYVGYGVKRRVKGKRLGRLGGWTYYTERVN